MTAILIGLTCFGFLVIGFLFVMGMCAVAAASDEQMEELLRQK